MLTGIIVVLGMMARQDKCSAETLYKALVLADSLSRPQFSMVEAVHLSKAESLRRALHAAEELEKKQAEVARIIRECGPKDQDHSLAGTTLTFTDDTAATTGLLYRCCHEAEADEECVPCIRDATAE